MNHASNVEFTNCTLVGNIAGIEGGGIYNERETVLTLTNSILWENKDLSGRSESAQIFDYAGNGPNTFFVNHSCIQNWSGVFGGVGNIGDDPLLVDPDGQDNLPGTEDDNLRLLRHSPCVDTGDNDVLPPDFADLDADGDTDEPIPFDFGGGPRVVRNIVDMGAYEYRPYRRFPRATTARKARTPIRAVPE